MTRKEYELIFQAFKSYRPFMTDAEEVLSEKILDDLFYTPLIDKLFCLISIPTKIREPIIVTIPNISIISFLDILKSPPIII